MATHLNLLLGGLFYSATLFLVACGLQLIFGVQKIVNLTCGSFYALGAYFGITVAGLVLPLGWPPQLVLLALVVGGAAAGLVAIPLERLLRPVYRRDPSYQLLLTFGLLLMFQDVFRFFWGATPRTIDGSLYAAFGFVDLQGSRVAVYNLIVIAASAFIAMALWAFLQRTRLGRIVRATAENRQMTEAMGVNTSRIFTAVFAIGCMLGTLGGALVAPTTAASLEMSAELVVAAFAVVVIGGLGSMFGALAGAVIVGLMKIAGLIFYPEAEVLAIYLVVLAVLLFKPEGLLGRKTA